jgi:uncharacterized protein YbjT (DUF2867 family)
MAPSVIVIGASGAVGRPLMAEFLTQKSNFGRIAVLSDPAKVARFSEIQDKGIEIVAGSFLEAKSYAGERIHYTLKDYIINPVQASTS